MPACQRGAPAWPRLAGSLGLPAPPVAAGMGSSCHVVPPCRRRLRSAPAAARLPHAPLPRLLCNHGSRQATAAAPAASPGCCRPSCCTWHALHAHTHTRARARVWNQPAGGGLLIPGPLPSASHRARLPNPPLPNPCMHPAPTCAPALPPPRLLHQPRLHSTPQICPPPSPPAPSSKHVSAPPPSCSIPSPPASPRRAGNLPGGRPAGLDLPHAQPAHPGRRALRRYAYHRYRMYCSFHCCAWHRVHGTPGWTGMRRQK